VFILLGFVNNENCSSVSDASGIFLLSSVFCVNFGVVSRLVSSLKVDDLDAWYWLAVHQ